MRTELVFKNNKLTSPLAGKIERLLVIRKIPPKSIADAYMETIIKDGRLDKTALHTLQNESLARLNLEDEEILKTLLTWHDVLIFHLLPLVTKQTGYNPSKEELHALKTIHAVCIEDNPERFNLLLAALFVSSKD